MQQQKRRDNDMSSRQSTDQQRQEASDAGNNSLTRPNETDVSANNVAENYPPRAGVNTRSRRRNFEDFVVVWLDANISITNDNKQAFAQLRKIVNRLETFNSTDECVDYITDIKDEKVFLIVSDSFGEQIIPRVHELQQIASIYVFCFNREHLEQWIQSFKIVAGVYADITPLCEQLQKDRRTAANDLLGIQAVSSISTSFPGKIGVAVRIIKSLLSTSKLSFIYAQLLNEILLEFSNTERSKKEMIDFCREQYSDNEDELHVISEFETSYVSENAIWWYKKECFLYRLINKALRTQDVDTLYNLKYYIQDLHKQIERKHYEFLNTERIQDTSVRRRRPSALRCLLCQCSRDTLHSKHVIETLTVYKGFGMPLDEFKSLKKKIGGFASIQTFMSTNRDESVARTFASKSIGKAGKIPALLKIEVDIERCKTPFADVQTQSEFKYETEILFTTGTVFRIKSFRLEEGVWNISLELAGEDDKKLCFELCEEKRQDIFKGDTLMKWVKLMWDMGDLDRSENFGDEGSKTFEDDYVDSSSGAEIP
ncbi:unnamed protein product [Didymodactylos carnosus]|uniref:Uncharacterized protein n=1 Tax=Didymodactylos carnosus TaxID=1234261 RepID=A0A8S2DI89_9BILA|nr:unnamed protein product [Didymodactylos carnosus]CAF3681133.1 unnamed protein product [Didymodactylos carnosus]